jgi:phage terminase large subunit-like protein
VSGRAAKAKPKPAPPPVPARDYRAIAEAFTADVLEVRFPAGRLFRAALKRQADDLASPPLGLVFRDEEADRACRFMELLPYPDGENFIGKPFVLQPWQVWLVRSLLGWFDPVTGFRRFRNAHIWIPKGNGKSPLAAMITLYILATARGGEKCYSAASTRKQARCVFDTAQQMLRLAPDVARATKLVTGEHAIKGEGDGRSYEPVSSEAGSIEGVRPEGILVLDEVHVLPNRRLYDNLRSAATKCHHPFLLTISTAGFDTGPEAIGWWLYLKTRDILEGRTQDPTTFALAIEADRDLDPFVPETWKQANPNLGVSVSAIGVASAAKEAQERPASKASFLTKHLGWWIQGGDQAWMDMAKWDACAVPGVQHYQGPRSIGLDLAQTRDLTAKVNVSVRLRADGEREYIATCMAYLPRESPTVAANPSILLWADEGWIVLVEGEVLSLDGLKADVLADLAANPGSEVCIDPWGAAALSQDLLAAGAVVVDIRQGTLTMSPAMAELEAAVLSGRFRHDGSPVMRWCMGNVIARIDKLGNMAPSRANDERKIDGAVALLDGMVRAKNATPASGDRPIMTFMDEATSPAIEMFEVDD